MIVSLATALWMTDIRPRQFCRCQTRPEL